MKLKFVDRVEEAPGVYSFIFEPGQPVEWQPGQYLRYKLPHPEADDRGVERWFTIASAPFERHIQLTTRMANAKGSSFKRALMRLEPGDVVETEDPKGSFVLEPGKKHILIAGGIGITPYLSMLKQLDHENRMEHVFLYYAHDDDQPAFLDYFKQLASKYPDAFGLREFAHRRLTIEDLQPYLSDPEEVFYLSGPKAMVENYQHMLEAAGVGQDRIKTDYFPGY